MPPRGHSRPVTEDRLIVIGAGPKALALAAKAHVLRGLGFRVPRVEVVERAEVGANWSGNFGYTDGRQPLGTSPEKDLGYPYETTCWGEEVGREIDARMLRYSWMAYQVSRGVYGDWVDRGKPSPYHRDWAGYLAWVGEAVGLAPRFGAVSGLAIDGGRWRVAYAGAAGAGEVVGEGLVITGPGTVRRPPGIPDHPRILTVETFWHDAPRFAELEGIRVAIVGTGETAAAVAANLTAGGARGVELDIYSPVGMAYSRGESYRENRVYTDPDQGNWQRLTPQHRRDFIRRTDRGVFSQDANRVLDRAADLQILPGRLVGAEVVGDRVVRAALEYHGERRDEDYDYLILATGADHLALLDEFLDPAGWDTLAGYAALEVRGQGDVETRIDYDLALRGSIPRLHLPMLAGLGQGPGFSNLSCLGRTADRVLEYYVDPPEPGSPPEGAP